MDLPAAFAKETAYTFRDNLANTNKATFFPVENRSDIGETQARLGTKFPRPHFD